MGAPLSSLESTRRSIRRVVRELRTARGLSQAELARKLEMSQSRLSEVEGGAGSFTAEQLVQLMRIFNVGIDRFLPPQGPIEDQLQNMLARFGALHLHERDDVLPDQRFERLLTLFRETLASARSPRLMTALAPVLARNIDTIDVGLLHAEVARFGREARFGWVAESTCAAIDAELKTSVPAPWAKLYRRTIAVVSPIVEHLRATIRSTPPDVLDTSIRSKESVDQIREESSPIAKRWNIMTAIGTDDFRNALRAARE